MHSLVVVAALSFLLTDYCACMRLPHELSLGNSHSAANDHHSPRMRPICREHRRPADQHPLRVRVRVPGQQRPSGDHTPNGQVLHDPHGRAAPSLRRCPGWPCWHWKGERAVPASSGCGTLPHYSLYPTHAFTFPFPPPLLCTPTQCKKDTC